MANPTHKRRPLKTATQLFGNIFKTSVDPLHGASFQLLDPSSSRNPETQDSFPVRVVQSAPTTPLTSTFPRSLSNTSHFLSQPHSHTQSVSATFEAPLPQSQNRRYDSRLRFTRAASADDASVSAIAYSKSMLSPAHIRSLHSTSHMSSSSSSMTPTYPPRSSSLAVDLPATSVDSEERIRWQQEFGQVDNASLRTRSRNSNTSSKSKLDRLAEDGKSSFSTTHRLSPAPNSSHSSSVSPHTASKPFYLAGQASSTSALSNTSHRHDSKPTSATAVIGRFMKKTPQRRKDTSKRTPPALSVAVGPTPALPDFLARDSSSHSPLSSTSPSFPATPTEPYHADEDVHIAPRRSLMKWRKDKVLREPYRGMQDKESVRTGTTMSVYDELSGQWTSTNGVAQVEEVIARLRTLS